MPSRLGHGLYKKIDRLKNIFHSIYMINSAYTIFLTLGTCARVAVVVLCVCVCVTVCLSLYLLPR